MKKQTARPVDREQDRYLREIEDRLRNRPTFDQVMGQMVCPMSFFEKR